MAAAHAQTAMQVDLTFVRSLDTIVWGNVEKQLFIEDVQLRTKKCANPDHENMPLFFSMSAQTAHLSSRRTQFPLLFLSFSFPPLALVLGQNKESFRKEYDANNSFSSGTENVPACKNMSISRISDFVKEKADHVISPSRILRPSALCSSGKREVVIIIAHAPNGSLTFISIPRKVQSHKQK